MEDLNKKIKDFLNNIDPETLKIIRISDMLPKLIRNFLISDILSEISLDKDTYDNEINNFYLKNKLNKNDNLNKLLKARGINEKDLQYKIILNIKINKIAEENFEKELKDYFLQQKEFLDEYTFNIIRVKNSFLANELYFQIDCKESEFQILSEKYSFFSPLYPNGKFGPSNLKGFNPIIRNKLFSENVGNLIKPFQVEEWWLIIKLIEKKHAKLDKKTSKMLLKEIFDKFINRLVKSCIEDYLNIY